PLLYSGWDAGYIRRIYAVGLFCVRTPCCLPALRQAQDERQHGTCRSFCVRFFRAQRGKTVHDKKESTAVPEPGEGLPKAQHANCVSPKEHKFTAQAWQLSA